MRKVTQQATQAFLARKAGSFGNTHTDGESLYLHGNKIARWTPGGRIQISSAGWLTNTTRERLSGLVHVISIAGRKWSIRLGPNDPWIEWDGSWITVPDSQ